MTASQNAIFNQVKEFVAENRSTSPSKLSGAELSMYNSFSAGERAFLISLAHDLHLTLSWDGYDDEDQNLVVLRFQGDSGPPLVDQDTECDYQVEVHTTAAVDLALQRYNEAAKIVVETAEDNFSSREELGLECNEWKRAYYLV